MGRRTTKWSTGEKIGFGLVVAAAGGLIAYFSSAGGTPESRTDQPPPNLTDELLGGQIQKLVDQLDASKHRKNWGMVALDALEQVVSGILPRWAGKLLDIVYSVERDAIEGKIAKTSKKTIALQRARAHYSTRTAN